MEGIYVDIPIIAYQTWFITCCKENDNGEIEPDKKHLDELRHKWNDIKYDPSHRHVMN